MTSLTSWSWQVSIFGSLCRCRAEEFFFFFFFSQLEWINLEESFGDVMLFCEFPQTSLYLIDRKWDILPWFHFVEIPPSMRRWIQGSDVLTNGFNWRSIRHYSQGFLGPKTSLPPLFVHNGQYSVAGAALTQKFAQQGQYF